MNWDPNCKKCELHEHRELLHDSLFELDTAYGTGPFVLFVVEAPSPPGVCGGADGYLLRGVTRELGLRNYAVASAVACRAGTIARTPDGGIRIGRTGLPFLYASQTPKTALTACKPRLLDLIYHLDPFYIITLGKKSTEVITGRSWAESDNGQVVHALLPGRRALPHLTTKGWARVAKGRISFPVTESTVRYAVMPTFALDYVNRYIEDYRDYNPLDKLRKHLQLVADVIREYEEVLRELHHHRDTKARRRRVRGRRSNHGVRTRSGPSRPCTHRARQVPALRRAIDPRQHRARRRPEPRRARQGRRLRLRLLRGNARALLGAAVKEGSGFRYNAVALLSMRWTRTGGIEGDVCLVDPAGGGTGAVRHAMPFQSRRAQEALRDLVDALEEEAVGIYFTTSDASADTGAPLTGSLSEHIATGNVGGGRGG